MRRSFRVKLMIAVLLVAVLVPSAVLFRIYQKGKQLQIEGMRGQLVVVAGLAADGLDGGRHAAMLAAPEFRASSDYAALREYCRQILERDERLTYLYTMVRAERPGIGRFVISLQRVREPGGGSRIVDAVSDFDQEYEYGRYPEFIRGFETPAADAEVTEDEDGITLSGYAPIRDASGRAVGLLGIDIDGETLLAMRRELRTVLVSNAIVSMILAWSLALLASRWLHRPVETMTHAMATLSSGDMSVRVALKSGDEFERMGRQFNRMAEGLQERQSLKASLAAAEQIQKNLLPSTFPEMPGFDGAGMSDYCDETGGDYFDMWKSEDSRRLAVTLGDVAGHGIGSALLMAAARTDLRSLAEQANAAPGTVFGALNRHLSRDIPPEKFLTLFFAWIDVATWRVTWISAAHEAMVWRAATGAFEDLAPTGIPLGIMADYDYAEGAPFTLSPGDMLVIGSDGIWEARNPAGEQYGQARFREAVLAARGLPAREMCRRVIDAVHAFRGRHPQLDDITIAVLKTTG